MLFSIILPTLEATGADWKFFGGTTFSSEKMVTFYDVESSKCSPDKKVKVWVKLIGQVILNQKMKTREKEIIKRTADEVAKGYTPPYALVNKENFQKYEDCVDIISWEVLANHFELQSRAKFLFEINCKEIKIRAIAGSVFKADGEIKESIKVPNEWDYISPESNSDTLQRILCK